MQSVKHKLIQSIFILEIELESIPHLASQEFLQDWVVPPLHKNTYWVTAIFFDSE
ncbi:MAG: hypothetical protein IPL26_16775 [Leptospiraceae bacterium]|nr:hypothetical protein [Leptospiraceae bacterium]